MTKLETPFFRKSDKTTLTGKKMEIIGAFSLFNPKQYMVVPISIKVLD
jgi:predicted lipoprotein